MQKICRTNPIPAWTSIYRWNILIFYLLSQERFQSPKECIFPSLSELCTLLFNYYRKIVKPATLAELARWKIIIWQGWSQRITCSHCFENLHCKSTNLWLLRNERVRNASLSIKVRCAFLQEGFFNKEVTQFYFKVVSLYTMLIGKTCFGRMVL